MADGTLPLSPASPGGQVEDIEELTVPTPVPTPPPPPGFIKLVRQRIQVVGRLYQQIAAVLDAPPAASEFGLVVRPVVSTSATPTITRVPANAGNVPLLLPNPNRRMACFYNQTATGVLFLKFGAVASMIDFTVAILPGGYYELPQPIWDGEIDGSWDVADGAVQVTELV
jgi:hypothetical protein